MNIQRVVKKMKKESSSIIAFCLLMAIILPLPLLNIDKSFFGQMFHDICVATREFVGFSTVFCLLVILFFVFSKYGSVKIGGQYAKPEYGNVSWVSCLIMAGLGIGIVFYCEEPLFHMNSNPYFGNVAGSAEEVAYSLTLFDWTLNAWSMYGVLGVIIAYFHYNKGRELKLSAAFPGRTNRWLKKIVDIVMALGIVAGLTTSLGLGVAQLKGGVEYVFDYDISPYLLMAVIGLVAVWSVNSGLKRGVKWLSNVTSVLIVVMLIVVVVLGYHSFDLKSSFTGYTLRGVKNFAQNFVSYNKFWEEFSDEWAAGWAVFYQLWFAAWAAFVAVFLAKISKGRTIRETMIAIVLLPTVLTAIWYGVFGNVGLVIKDELFALMQQNLPHSLFYLLKQLAGESGSVVLSVAVMLTICCIFVTSSDSSSYVVATLLSKDKEVRALNKIVWGCVQCGCAMLLYYCGGLSLIQSASVVLGLAVLVIILLGSVYFIYVLVREDRSKSAKMPFSNLCIVFGSDHYNPLGIVRSLGEIGVSPVVVLVGENPVAIPASKYPQKIHYVKSNEEGLALIKSEYGRRKEKCFILTGSDDTTALLNEHYDELKDDFYFYNCGEQGRLNHFMQKEVLNQLAEDCGVNVARREVVKRGELPKNLRYPIITKAVNSLSTSWKNTMHICHNAEELLGAYKDIEDEDVLLQEYIIKKNELCIDAVACNEGKDVFIPINSFYHRLFDKSYGYYYYFTQFDNKDLTEKISLMLQKAKFTGIFSVEFLVDENDQLYFLEINFRNSTWSHASTAAGYNLVHSWIDATLNGRINRECVNITKLPFNCLVEINEYRANVKTKKISKLQFMKDIRNSDYLTYWNREDNGPFWAIVKNILAKKLPSRRNS